MYFFHNDYKIILVILFYLRDEDLFVKRTFSETIYSTNCTENKRIEGTKGLDYVNALPSYASLPRRLFFIHL